jgi:hypothetical protein
LTTLKYISIFLNNKIPYGETYDITITDKARDKIIEAFKNSEFLSPALRIIFSGVG